MSFFEGFFQIRGTNSSSDANLMAAIKDVDVLNGVPVDAALMAGVLDP